MYSEEIIVGLSGGIDSLVSLFLLKKQGFSPIGVSLQIPNWKNKENNFSFLRSFSKKFNVPYFVIDARKEFKEVVVKYFLDSLKKGETPNPCIICNRYFKIKKLLEFAKKHNIKYVATGHYAKIEYSNKKKEYLLKRGVDREKDQSYFLALLPQRWLSHLIFPLGEYTKKEVKKLAEKYKIPEFAKKKESQDFCYVSSKEKNNFLLDKIGKREGNIVTEDGRIIGKHQGIYFFTIGQRKGIKIPGKILYVKGINPKKNLVIVTEKKDELEKKEIEVSPFHFISSSFTKENKIKGEVKTRYKSQSTKAILYHKERKSKKVKIAFQKEKTFPTPGQFAVFYKGDICLGGGPIKR